MYRARHLEDKLRGLSKVAKVILVVGARQVGKSTLLSHCFPELRHITFDPVQDFYNIRQNPDLFVQQFTQPVIFDEVQFYPEILSAIKRHADEKGQPGQYFLTGSQNLSVLKNVAESMAGRVVILKLAPLTLHEEYGVPDKHWLPILLEDPFLLKDAFSGTIKDFSLWNALWRGGMPSILDTEEKWIPDVREAYISTYVERDIRLIEDVRNLTAFDQFIRLVAALSAQEITEANLGQLVEVSHPTIARWFQLLAHTYQWHQLPPYHGNTLKRITKKSKGIFADTGIACHLIQLNSPLAVGSYPQFGALFESFVVNQIIAVLNSLPLTANLYHWRTKGGAEVDLLIEKDDILYPIEIKTKSALTKKDGQGIRMLRETYSKKRIAPGVIIYPGNHCFMVTEDLIALPCHGIFQK